MTDPAKMTLEELTNWLWNTPQKTHNQIHEALEAFAAQAREEALDDLTNQLVLQGDMCELCITSLGDAIRSIQPPSEGER